MVRNIFLMCLVLLLLVMQYHGALTIAGTSPNILLVVALAVAIGGASVGMLTLSLIVILGGGMLFSTFWLVELLTLITIVVLVKIFIRPITGNSYVDFLIIVIAATIMFTIFARIPFGTPVNVWVLIKEIIYNGIIALISWPLVRRLAQTSST